MWFNKRKINVTECGRYKRKLTSLFILSTTSFCLFAEIKRDFRCHRLAGCYNLKRFIGHFTWFGAVVFYYDFLLIKRYKKFFFCHYVSTPSTANQIFRVLYSLHQWANTRFERSTAWRWRLYMHKNYISSLTSFLLSPTATCRINIPVCLRSPFTKCFRVTQFRKSNLCFSTIYWEKKMRN